MPIRQFFHLMLIVDDHDLAEARFAALLAPRVFQPKGWSDFDKRWASLTRVRGPGCAPSRHSHARLVRVIGIQHGGEPV